MIRFVCLVVNAAVIAIGIKMHQPHTIIIGGIGMGFTLLSIRMARGRKS